MKKIAVLIFFCFITLSDCLGQSNVIAGNWSSCGAIKDTLSLTRGGEMYNIDYINRDYAYVDTNYYWHFYNHDSVRVDYVIRTCRIIPRETPDTVPVPTYTLVGDLWYYKKKDAKKVSRELTELMKGSKTDTNTIEKDPKPKTKNEDKNSETNKQSADSTLIMIDGKQYRILTTTKFVTSCWNLEKGTWKIQNDNILQISGTTLLNGTYTVQEDIAGKLVLVRKDKP